jgi:hypothetical protein
MRAFKISVPMNRYVEFTNEVRDMMYCCPLIIDQGGSEIIMDVRFHDEDYVAMKLRYGIFQVKLTLAGTVEKYKCYDPIDYEE